MCWWDARYCKAPVDVTEILVAEGRAVVEPPRRKLVAARSYDVRYRCYNLYIILYIIYQTSPALFQPLWLKPGTIQQRLLSRSGSRGKKLRCWSISPISSPLRPRSLLRSLRLISLRFIRFALFSLCGGLDLHKIEIINSLGMRLLPIGTPCQNNRQIRNHG